MTISDAITRAHEWIGLKVKIITASDPSHRGVTGIVENETRNMFTIRTDVKTVRIPKDKSSFLIETSDRRAITIDGSSVRHRPENRIKKAIGKW